MTAIKPIPTIAQALATLCDLPIQDPLFLRLAREHNHYLECLHQRGDRFLMNPQDFHVLLCRMLDIAQIEPINEGQSNEPDPRPVPRDAFKLSLAAKKE